MAATVLNPLEIAIYTLALTGGTDGFTCLSSPEQGPPVAVACGRGLTATLDADGNIQFKGNLPDTVLVTKRPDGTLAFSNGMTTHWGSAGWVQFSTGLSVRRDRDGSFRFSNGMRCKAEGSAKARCIRQD